MRGAFRLRRRCSVMVLFAWRCCLCLWHIGAVASSRPRVTFRMHPRHRWCCGVVHSRMREAFRLRRWCSVLAWSASQCYSITLVVLCVVLGCVFPLCSPLFVCLEYSVFALSLLPCPPVILVHLNPSCKKAAKPYRQMNIIQVVEGLPLLPR